MNHFVDGNRKKLAGCTSLRRLLLAFCRGLERA